jgi:prepilin-type processing-associated H-X9-DG protein
MNATAPRARQIGFTLLELLVIVAILAILAGLLFAVLRKGRDQAHAAECVSNLRTLAGANLRYAAENGGQFCWAMDSANRRRWHGERNRTKDKFDPTRGPLAPYLGRDAKVKNCPALAVILKGKQSFEEGAGGYGYNAIYIGGTPANKWEAEVIGNVERPERTIMFADTAMARKDGVQEYPFAEPWQHVLPNGKPAGKLDPSIHFRHNGCAHIAWCDGHVSAERPSELGEVGTYGGNNRKLKIGWIGPKEENGYWNPRRTTPE